MSLATTLTDRASRFLGRSTSRRGFVAKSAVVGSALTVATKQFVLKPGSAYAAVCSCNGRSCNCGDLCCDGYTEFCCHIYGENSCPPGTLLAGWWKVDNSSFCDGDARYYMDCNDECGSCGCGSNGLCSRSCSGARCGCRACGNRKDGCTVFRYGNCNNQVRCVGAIQCRVVTCTKPWELEPTCTTAQRTDNNTRFHHRPCLETPTTTTTLPPVTEIAITGVTGGLRFVGRVVPDDLDGAERLVVFSDRSPVGTIDGFDEDGAFDVTIAHPPGQFEICVYAQADTGDFVQLTCETVERTS